MRTTIALFFILLFGADTSMTQTIYSEYGLVIVIKKYERNIDIYGRTHAGGELLPAQMGELYRSFPTGPKAVFGDERIPEGIYDGKIDSEGNVSIVFHTYPGIHEFTEVYRITGPSLDRNVIPLRDGFEEEIRGAGISQLAIGMKTIPVIVLPGNLEPEVAEMLKKARNVKKGQGIDDVERSVRRWKPVEECLIETGRIPKLRFEGDNIHILEDNEVPSPVYAEQ